MNLIYKKIFDIKIFHDYFGSGLCKSIKLLPFKETATVLKNYEIKIDQNSGTFSFYVGTTEAVLDEGIFTGVGVLYFTLQAVNKEFYNYTQIPFPVTSKTLFFENDKEPSETLLSKGKIVGTDDMIAVKSEYFNVDVPENTSLLQIKDLDGDVIYELKDVGIYKGKCPVNLKGRATGLLALWLDNGLKEKFLYLNATSDSIAGVLKLSIENIPWEAMPYTYELSFITRKVFWQYKIGSTSTKTKIKKMSVSKGQEILFTGPVSEKIANGQEVSVFTSPEPLNFEESVAESPVLKLDYSGNFSSEINTTDIKLPNLEPENLKPFKTQQNENHLLVSTIVYV